MEGVRDKFGKFIKGHKRVGNAWYERTQIIRDRISQTLKGRHNSPLTEIKKGQHISSNTEFKNGHINSIEVRKKLSEILKGRKFTEEWKKKISNANKGEKSWNWKGGISKDKVKYSRDKYNNDNKYRMVRLNDCRKRRSGGKLSIQTIQQVYEDNIKQYGTLTCYLCFKLVEFKQDCLEHKIPLSRGGTNEYNNLAISHRSCNNKKFTKTEEEYRNKEVCH